MPKKKIYQENDHINNGIMFVKELEPLVISYNGKTRTRRIVIVECKCGKHFEAKLENISSGDTSHCGCVKRIAPNRTHNLSKHPLYSVYSSMIGRCHNSNDTNYKNYGGRGIKVCDKWHDIKNFFNDIEPIYKKGLELNRIDNDGDYAPNNVNFITHQENSAGDRIIQTNNSSGYRGVCTNTQGIKIRWRAVITINQKQKYLGTYNTKLEAAKAYNNYIDKNNLPHTKNEL
jgi:hypothetical protein